MSTTAYPMVGVVCSALVPPTIRIDGIKIETCFLAVLNKPPDAMTTLQEIKNTKEASVTALISGVGMFFAFSTEQFNENKTPITPGEKYLHIGAGAYLPKSNYPKYVSGLKQINKAYKESVNENNLRRQNIVAALHNHEAYSTGEVELVMVELGSDYTEEEVRAELV